MLDVNTVDLPMITLPQRLVRPSRDMGPLVIVKDLGKNVPQKRDSGTFLGHLSFWVSGMESPLIFYTKNKKN